MIAVLIFIATLILGAPIAFAIGLTALTIIIQNDMPVMLLAQRMFTGVDSFTLMAIPFFLLAGELMNHGGVTSRLINFCLLLVGRFTGGLAQVNVVVNMIFAGISGSAAADAAALGSILIPSMEKQGYSRKFSAALTAAASCLGPIIPPSIIMVIFAMATSVSIGALFLGGIVPGIIFGISLMIYCRYYAKRHGHKGINVTMTKREMAIVVKDAILALVAPLIILGGILSGAFTPTEAGAVAVAYALFLGIFVYKELKLSDLPTILINTAATTGTIYLIISTAAVLAWVITFNGIAFMIQDFIIRVAPNPHVIMFIMLTFLLFVGTFMEAAAAVILLAPVFLPIFLKFGYDPIHIGVTMCIAMVIGLITPPVGISLFVVAKIGKLSLEEVCSEILPFIIATTIVLFFVGYVPALTLTVPNWFFSK